MAKRVALFGGTGMVGKRVVRQLVADGLEVTAVVLDEERARKELPEEVTLFEGNVEKQGPFQEVLARVDTAIIIMPLSIGERDGFVPERDGTRNIVEALPDTKTVELIKLSEIGVGSDPSFFDLQCKAEAEDIVRASGHPFVVFRPTWFMESWPEQLYTGSEFMVVGSSRRRIHWVALNDMALWMSRAVSRFEQVRGKTLTVQGRDGLTFQKAATIMSEATGSQLLHLPVDGVAPPGSSPELQRTLHELFRYYDRYNEEFEAGELWQLLGAPENSFDQFADETAKRFG